MSSGVSQAYKTGVLHSVDIIFSHIACIPGHMVCLKGPINFFSLPVTVQKLL